MKASERIAIIGPVADALTPRGWARVDLFLEQFGVPTNVWEGNDLNVYVQRCLTQATDEVLVEVAEHFGIPVPRVVPPAESGHPIWTPGEFRLFISHVAVHKTKATALRNALNSFGISSFVAHEDIHPSLEWQKEIERALMTMDALLALVTSDFHESLWTDQEVGYALCRGLLVIPIRAGADPYGFFGKHQAVQGSGRVADQIAPDVYDALCTNPLTQAKMVDSAVSLFAGSGSFRTAEANARRLLRFHRLTPQQFDKIEDACLENGEIFASFGCPEIIRELYAKHHYVPKTVPEDWSIPVRGGSAA